MEHLDKQSAYVANHDAFGHVRIWRYNLKDGAKELLVEKKNMITKEGADIAARALSGLPNTSISHMYIGHGVSTSVPTVTVSDTITSFTAPFRKKLAFAPSFSNEAGYVSNLVYFSTYITGTEIPNGNKITSLGLVNATDPNSAAGDKLFSRIAFSPITYDSSHGLAITWGITFRAQ